MATRPNPYRFLFNLSTLLVLGGTPSLALAQGAPGSDAVQQPAPVQATQEPAQAPAASAPSTAPAQTAAPSTAAPAAEAASSADLAAPATEPAPPLEAAEENVTDQEEGTPLEVHGFVSQGFLMTTDNNYLGHSERGSFELTEVGINFTKGLTDDLRVGVQLFAHDLGRLGNYQPTFDWYYLDYRLDDWLGIRIGRTKLPFGLYNETNDIDAARVPVLLPQSVYPAGNRDFLLAQTGLELYGFLPLGAAGSVEYRAYGGTLFLDTSNSNSAAGQISDFSVPYLVGGRLMWLPPIQGLQLGGSLQALRLDLDFVPSADTLQALQDAGQVPAGFGGVVEARVPAVLWVGSLEYTYNDFLFATEFSRWSVDTESNLPAMVPESSVVSDRFYAMTSYRAKPWFTPGFYYSVFVPKSGETSHRKDYQHDFALTTRFDVNDHWLIKLEGHYMRGTAGLNAIENDNTPPSALERNWGLFIIKTTAYF
jgi:hypothetical protein